MDSTNTLPQVEQAQAQKEVTVNALFASASPALMFGRNDETSSGLTWGYLGGRWGGTLVSNGTLALPPSSTVHIVARIDTGAVEIADGSPDGWTDDGFGRLFEVITGTTAVVSYQDHRAGPRGIFASGGGGGGGGALATLADVDVSGADPGDSLVFDGSLWVPGAGGGGGGLTNFSEDIATASPNVTVPVASLTPVNAATDVDAALIPKGAGSILASVPDGTTTAGNKRGARAVDLQMVRSNANQVASGGQAVVGGGNGNRASGNTSTVAGGTTNAATSTGDFVGGGQSNTASGGNSVVAGGGGSGVGNGASGIASAVCGGASNNASGNYSAVGAGQGNNASGGYSTVPGGAGNTADGDYSSASGIQATTLGMRAARVHSGGWFGGTAPCELVELVLRRETTDATQTILTSGGSTASNTTQLVLPNNSAYAIRGLIVSRQDSTGDTKAWEFSGVVKRGASAAATAIVGSISPSVIAADSGASAWAVAVDADTTNGCLRVQFTGEASKTIRTACDLRAVLTVG